jgi:Zn-dependent alcohol dehydrogenase
MKKIEEGLYEYKGVEVKKLSNGNYVARFYVNSICGQCRVCGSTQANFMKMFNNFVKQNKGLNMERYQQWINRR